LAGAQEPDYQVQEVSASVLRDGSIYVTYVLDVNSSAPSISLPLLVESPDGIFATDERNLPVSLQVIGGNVTLNTLGATSVQLEYGTTALSSKQGAVWTIVLDLPYAVNVSLPEGATIVYLNDIPELIEPGTRLVMHLAAGPWEISYTLPFPTATTTPTASGTQTTTQPVVTPPPALFSGATLPLLAGAVAAAVAVPVGALVWRRRASRGEELGPIREEDKRIMAFVHERGGRVMEAELRQRFLLPKTTMWRTVRRLERAGLIRVRKVGLQNELELVK
jgi:uncharacterized membrane protein